MEMVEAIQSRRSIRGFRSESVPREVLRRILEIASRAPSSANSQSWEVIAVSGQVLDSIRNGNIAMASSATPPGHDVPHQPLAGIYYRRQVDLAIQLFNYLGIARNDRERRDEWARQGLKYFGAPVALFLCADSSLDDSFFSFDLGLLAQTICLAALSEGLGTCIERQGVTYPQVIRQYIPIARTKRIVISLAIGYPDWNHPANQLRTPREPVEDTVRWFGFTN